MVGSARLNPRARLREAESRATSAAAAEREANLIAGIACALLADAGPGTEAATMQRIAAALEPAGLRLELKHSPCPAAGETALPLHLKAGSGWLYLRRDGDWHRDDADRIARRLSELLDQAQERTARSDSVADGEAHRRTEIAKSSILHAICTDLAPPLTAVKTAASELTDTQVGDEDRARLTEAIAYEAARLERMVADLADLSRIGARAVNPKPDWCDLNETIDRALAEVQRERGPQDVRLTLPAGLPPVRADRAQLERVFTNLIDNAVKFSPAGSAVEIRGAAANGRVTIRVIDRGRGIASANQSQIFEPFVRGAHSEPGSGLGLAICRGFVEANGGRISLQSQARDGSSFTVSFPLAEQPSAVS
ncbi:MAG: sensor histidine kinase [Thermoleophilaceae bacterium]